MICHHATRRLRSELGLAKHPRRQPFFIPAATDGFDETSSIVVLGCLGSRAALLARLDEMASEVLILSL